MDIKNILNSLLIYLDKYKWVMKNTQYKGLSVFLNDNYDGINIVLPKDINIPDASSRVDDAINLLCLLNETERDVFINSLLRFEIDFHNYRVPGKEQYSVPLSLAEEIISSTKRIIYLSAQQEYDRMKNYFQKVKKSKIEISNEYVENCKFGHTWKGSFGFTIEAPLNVPTIGFFNDEPANYERKISQRIYSGMKIIKQAEELKSDTYIIDNVETGFNGKMLKEILEIGEHIKYNSIEYSTSWAPVLPVTSEYTEVKCMELTRTTFNIVEKAAAKLKIDEDEVETIFYGFPIGLKSTKEQLLDQSLEGNRFIYVKGYSDSMGETTLKLELGFTDYLKAVHAHENQKDVIVKCIVKKKLRGWEIIKLNSFELLDNE